MSAFRRGKGPVELGKKMRNEERGLRETWMLEKKRKKHTPTVRNREISNKSDNNICRHKKGIKY